MSVDTSVFSLTAVTVAVDEVPAEVIVLVAVAAVEGRDAVVSSVLALLVVMPLLVLT